MSARGGGGEVTRGSIWWVDLGEPLGSEPGFRRPVVVVSADSFNRSAISTVMAVVITSNLALAAAPGNVRLPKGTGSLPKASVVNISQIVTIDRSRLVERIGSVPAAYLARMDDGLRLGLEL